MYWDHSSHHQLTVSLPFDNTDTSTQVSLRFCTNKCLITHSMITISPMRRFSRVHIEVTDKPQASMYSPNSNPGVKALHSEQQTQLGCQTLPGYVFGWKIRRILSVVQNVKLQLCKGVVSRVLNYLRRKEYWSWIQLENQCTALPERTFHSGMYSTVREETWQVTRGQSFRSEPTI